MGPNSRPRGFTSPLLFALIVGAAMGQSPEQYPQDVYRRTLANLDQSKIGSISLGMESLQLLAPGLPVAQVDSLADQFMTFFEAAISLQNDQMWEDLPMLERIHADDDRNDRVLRSFYRELHANGLALYNFGRLYYIDQQSGYLVNHFILTISPALRAYLLLREAELIAGFSDNDSLLISFEKVSERVLRWEQFLVEHPGSIAHGRGRHYYMIYISTLLTGLKETPAFLPGGELRPELVMLYDNISKKYSDSPTGILVRQFYDSLIEGDFRWSPAVRDFYVAHGIRNMHTAQVPFR